MPAELDGGGLEDPVHAGSWAVSAPRDEVGSGGAPPLLGSSVPQLDVQDVAAHDEPGWTFVLEPFLWLAGIEGEGGDGTAPPVDIGENVSLFGSIDGGFLLALDAHAPDGRYSLLADGLYLSLADDEGSLQTDTDALMLELGAGLPLGSGSSWEAIAGLRYVELQFSSDTASISTDSRSNWIDPWLGARGDIAFDERWGLRLRGDVGGFGVGTQFSWQGVAALGARLGESVRFDLGYRAISLDFDDDELEYDALIRGPFFGFAFEL